MVVKVCGIKTMENIETISKLKVGMIGLNFYPPSVRYIKPDILANHFDNLPKEIYRVGVFVNESLEIINELAIKFNLDYIQLHGDEDVEFCNLVAKNHKLIKVFRIDNTTDFTKILEYSFASYFLFDTATKYFGGSGKKFDWSKLDEYKGDIPFLLSGGIGPLDTEAVLTYCHPKYIGIDINSKFESSPGIKDSKLLDPFLKKINSKK